MLEKYKEIGPIASSVGPVHYFMVWFFRDRKAIVVAFLKK